MPLFPALGPLLLLQERAEEGRGRGLQDPRQHSDRNWGTQLGLNTDSSIIDGTLLNFKGKLISNGLAAMSPDCSRSQSPGNVLVVLSEPNIMELKGRKERKSLRKCHVTFSSLRAERR